MPKVELTYTNAHRTEVFTRPGSYPLTPPEGYSPWATYKLDMPTQQHGRTAVEINIQGEVSRIRLTHGESLVLPAEKNGNKFVVWGILRLLTD